MEGFELLKVLIESTGLPHACVERELARILSSRGLDPATLTLEDVRQVLSAYLQDVLLEAKETSVS